MELARDRLEHFGSIQRKRSTAQGVVFMLRFREYDVGGGCVHRSIALGHNAGIVARARQLLAEWQSLHDPAKSTDPAIRDVWRIIRDKSLKLKRRDREAFLRHYQAAGPDLHKIWAATTAWPQVEQLRRLRRRGGRPRRGRLAL